MWTIEQLKALADTHPRQLIAVVLDLQDRLQELQSRLAKNSRNSSQPPSSDGMKKLHRTQSQREPSGRKPGGQHGHCGSTLQQVSHPDRVIRHEVSRCRRCFRSLAERPADSIERRQIFDIPPLKVEVTEHQSELKVCPGCGTANRAEFPEGVCHVVEYGNRSKALALYLV